MEDLVECPWVRPSSKGLRNTANITATGNSKIIQAMDPFQAISTIRLPQAFPQARPILRLANYATERRATRKMASGGRQTSSGHSNWPSTRNPRS